MSGEEAACLMAEAPELDAIDERERINDLLRRIAQLGTDSKARCLKIELEACLAVGFDSMIVFTQYTDTMEYLRDYLATRCLECRLPVTRARAAPGAMRAACGCRARRRRSSAGSGIAECDCWRVRTPRAKG